MTSSERIDNLNPVAAMESVELSQSSKEASFDVTKCVICQKSTKVKAVSTSNGCKRIREASAIHNDHVSKLLKLVEGDGFIYHVTNQCYKKYTMKSVLSRMKNRDILNEQQTTQEPALSQDSTSQNRTTRSQSIGRPPPNPEITAKSVRDMKCIICDNKCYKQVYTKYRISESNRAALFLAATNFFQDAVFTRTCDLQDSHSVFGADIYIITKTVW